MNTQNTHRNGTSFHTKRGNRVFKKTENSKSWIFEKVINRRRYQFRLGKHLPTAKSLADEIDAYMITNSVEDAVLKYKKGVSDPINGKIPLIGDIVERYRLTAPSDLGVQKESAKVYCNSLLHIIDKHKSLLDLNDGVISEYKKSRLEGVDDEDDIKARKRSINSVLRNAKSLFGKEAMGLYKDWNMEGIAPLMGASSFKRVRKIYRLPPSDLVNRTFELCDRYESEGDTDYHIVLNLALNFGLRRNEIFNSRRAWVEIPDEGPARVGVFSERSFHVKSGEDGYAFGSAVSARKLLELSEGFDYLVSSRNPRTCLDPVVSDLRGIGWGDKCKPLHECRKLYGSYLATTQSLYYAQKSLRHASAMTTNDFYADLMTDDGVISLWGA